VTVIVVEADPGAVTVTVLGDAESETVEGTPALTGCINPIMNSKNRPAVNGKTLFLLKPLTKMSICCYVFKILYLNPVLCVRISYTRLNMTFVSQQTKSNSPVGLTRKYRYPEEPNYSLSC